jgi:transposase
MTKGATTWRSTASRAPAGLHGRSTRQGHSRRLNRPEGSAVPFGSWTLDRLQAYLNVQKGILIKHSRIDEIVLAEDFRWRNHETWFGK